MTDGVAIRCEGLAMFPDVQELYASVGYFEPIASDCLVISARDERQRIIGTVRIALEHGVLVLRGMMIAPSHERCGIGTRMLWELDKHVGQRECFCLPHSWLENCYGQIGFKVVLDNEAP